MNTEPIVDEHIARIDEAIANIKKNWDGAYLSSEDVLAILEYVKTGKKS